MCISCAISLGLVRILFCLSMMESRGEVSKFLKNFLFLFLGLFSYIWRYFETALWMQSLLYFVVIILASLLALISIHSFDMVSIIGGWGICTFRWLRILSIIGCVCHCGSFFAIYIVFSMRWDVARCFFIFGQVFGVKNHLVVRFYLWDVVVGVLYKFFQWSVRFCLQFCQRRYKLFPIGRVWGGCGFLIIGLIHLFL